MAKEAFVVMKDDRIPMTLTSDVEVGDVIKIGTNMIGIAGTSGLTGETITVYVTNVAVEIEAATEDEIKVGDKLYFDHINRVLTIKADNGADIKYNPAGHAITAKDADTAGTVQILLNR